MQMQFDLLLVQPRRHEETVCILVFHHGVMTGYEINERLEGQEGGNSRAKGQKDYRHAK